MKLNKILFAAALASVIGGSMTSCSESFLDEDLKTQYSTDRFKTQEGLDELVTGAYQKLKFKFNYSWAIEAIWTMKAGQKQKPAVAGLFFFLRSENRLGSTASCTLP